MVQISPSEVRIGAYLLEVGTDSESFAEFGGKQEKENARAVAGALAEAPDEPTVIDAVEELEERATAVTDRIERAHALSQAIAAGVVERDLLMREIDSLLGFLDKLDRSGRFDDQLRLARALHRLLVLTFRWLDLVRMLRAALRSSRAANDAAGEAWAQHELGCLHLCAGDPKSAEELFSSARELQRQLGHATGRCATRHNLDCARRDRSLRTVHWRGRLIRLGGVSAVLAVIGIGGGGGPISASDTAPTAAHISVGRASLDLGHVAVGEVGPARSLSVTNTGGRPLRITRVTAGARPAIRLQSDCLRSLRPGAGCVVTVRFAPDAAGTFSAELAIAGIGVRSRKVALSGIGVGVREASVRPGRVAFGRVAVGRRSSPRSLFVAAGSQPFTVAAVSADSSEFSVGSRCESTIAPGRRCVVRVRFQPTTPGLRHATLTIVGNGRAFMLRVPLQGVGAAGRLSVSPTRVDFGDVRLRGGSARRSLRVANTGNAPVRPRAALTRGASDFSLSGTCPRLDPGESCELQTSFAPAAEGKREGTVTIRIPAGEALAVQLTGTGAQIKPTLTPQFHDFGQTEILTRGETFAFTLTAGSANLTPETQLSPTKEFRVVEGCDGQLSPHTSCTVAVAFVPTSDGRQRATLTIQTTEHTRLTATIVGTGTIVAPTLTPSLHDFGTVDLRSRSKPFSFTLAAGSEAFDPVVSATPTKEFRFGGSCGGRLEPHETCSVDVTFTPLVEGARNGAFNVRVHGAILSSELRGTGKAVEPVLAPSRANFGTVSLRRRSGARTFTVTAGSRALPVPTLSIRSKDFAVSRNGCTTALAAFASCTFDVVFTPAAFGRRTATLSVKTSSPLATTLTGFGWAQASWSVSKASVVLYIDRVNRTATETVVISVATTSLAPLLSPTASISGSTYFHVSSNCTGEVAAATQCTVAITFSPTGPLNDTTRRATLTISSRNGGTKTVALYGATAPE